ncbi:MAG: aminotransferase class IV [Stackebrandtia sp.]
MAEVLAVLDKGVVNSNEALLCGDDLGVLRGDGVFETVNVRAGVPFLLDEHLTRMAGSARRLDIDLPDADRLRTLARQACEGFGDAREGALRLICTRGLEAGSAPTVYATVNPVGESVRLARREGLRMTGLSMGYTVDARARAPWLLGGAKCLSYAATMAVQRYAKEAGYDDALWVSEDGFALEGPTSTLVWLDGDTLCTVPLDTGILFGTTAAYLFEHAGDVGLRTKELRIRPEELAGADGVWMTSSVRGVAPVRSLDLTRMPRGGDAPTQIEFGASAFGAKLQGLAGFPLPT